MKSRCVLKAHTQLRSYKHRWGSSEIMFSSSLGSTEQTTAGLFHYWLWNISPPTSPHPSRTHILFLLESLWDQTKAHFQGKSRRLDVVCGLIKKKKKNISFWIVPNIQFVLKEYSGVKQVMLNLQHEWHNVD